MTDHVSRANLAVAAICFPATAIVLWLAFSFWLDARHQKTDATNVLITSRFERDLLSVTAALANERSVILASTSTTAMALQFSARRQTTLEYNERLVTTIDAIENLLSDHKVVSRLRYSKTALSTLIDNIRSAKNNLQERRQPLKNSFVSNGLRSNDVKESFFKDTSLLINQIHKLQTGLHYQPVTEIRKISQLRAFSNAVRDLGEHIAAEHASRLIQLHNRKADRLIHSSQWEVTWQQVQQNFISIQEFRDLRSTDPDWLNRIDGLLQLWLSSQPAQKITPAGAVKLLKINSAIQTEIQSILESGNLRLNEYAAASKAHGTRRLIIDSILLFFACWIVYASIRLVLNINHHAYHDRLTKLPNRFRFDQILKDAINLQCEKNGTLSVAVLDIDNFQLINSSFGHLTGNLVLTSLATRLFAELGSQGTLALLSDDKFAVVTNGRCDSKATEHLVNQLVVASAAPFYISGLTINITISAGLCHFDKTEKKSNLLTEHAEIALHRAKDNGKNRLEVFDPKLGKVYQHRIALEIDLPKAIEEDQLLLYYQPKINTSTGKVDGAEALVRWQHPKHGMVPPIQFIGIAERSGQIVDIGEWVLNEACRQMSEWKQQGVELQVAVNVSARQFAQHNFLETVQYAMQRHDIDPDSIELEVTEGVGVEGMETVVERLKILRSMGISIAIDDFGTGYSSLQYLEDLPLDTLKIDRAFINKIDAEKPSDSLVSAVMSLAKAYQLKTVAEGVETNEQLNRVLELGCHYIQGFYYSKPVAASELPAVIQRISDMGNFIDRKAA